MADASVTVIIEGQDNASDAIRSVTENLEGLEAQSGKTVAGVSGVSDGISQSGAAAEQTARKIKDFGKGFNTITKPIQAAAVGLIGAGAATAATAIKFEDNFASVEKTVEGTTAQLEAVKKGIIDLGTVGRNGRQAIPSTTADLTELAAVGGQMGIATENIVDFTEVMAQMGSATNLGGAEGASTLARFMNVTNVAQTDVRRLGSSIVDLGNNFATSEAEIAALAMRMGATGYVVGISAQDILAYSTVLSSMGVEAEAGGSAVSRIWAQIQSAVSSGSEDLEAFAEVSGVSAAAFAEQWKTDASGAFMTFLEGLSKSEDQIAELDNLGFGNIRDIQALQRLASSRGIELLTEAIKRSNTAWAENVALQEEADKKGATLASQLTVTKNNVAEAARSFGELIMPSVSEASGAVMKYAQNLASMDDEQKAAWINTAKGVVVTGLATKGIVAATKGVGGAVEAIDKMKPLISGIAKAAPAIGPVAVGIAGIAAAVAVGKVAYDAWYTSQYRWSEGLSEGNQKVKESLDSYKRISDIQREIKDLKLIIGNSDSSAEQVETAKQRLEEIKQLLSEEYNLVINSDNSNLDKTVENIKKLEKNQLQDNINSQKGKLTDLLPKIEGYDTQKKALESQLNLERETAARYGDFRLEVAGLNKESSNYGQTVLDLAEKYGILSKAQRAVTDPMTVMSNANLVYQNANSEVDKLSGKLTSLTSAKEEVSAITEELANWETEMIKIAAQNGDTAGIQQALKDMKGFIDIGELDMEGYAQAAALAMNGIDSLEAAWSSAANGDGQALNAVIRDYISSMQSFGASAAETAAGAALIQNGFRTISEAAAAGRLDVVSAQATQLAHAMGLLPEDVNIEINTDGTVTWHSDSSEPDSYSPVADGTANFGMGSHPTKAPDIDGTANYGMGSHPTKAPDIYGTAHYTISVTTTSAIAPNGSFSHANSWSGKAKGTSSFEGGLAMVNDQTGISDNRELIIDRGRAFIPQGKNVILPLSRGAKIYTAAQTKSIMGAMGIPRYASGKDNSDGFTAAVDDWTHYTRTHAVTSVQELEKWNALLKDEAENSKDVADAEEKIFSAKQKVNEELDKASDAYIENRSFNNDWADYGDTPIDAFSRYKERQNDLAAAAEQTWAEADEKIKDFGQKLYDDHQAQSLKWVEHQKKYCGMTVEEEIEAYKRIQAYTLAYYEQGLIDREEYRAAAQEIDEKYIDAYKTMQENQYSSWEKDMSNYLTMRNTYDDWEAFGDSESAMYARAIKRADEFQKAEVIGWQEAQDAKFDYSIKMYEAASKEYDDMLAKQSEKISKLKEKYSAQEQELRDSWDEEDRAASLSEVNHLLSIYSDSTTDAGKQKYKDLQEQKKQLEREDELYAMQTRHTEILDDLQAEYDSMEQNKKKALASLRIDASDISTSIDDVRELADRLSVDYGNASTMTISTLYDILGVLQKIAANKSSTYNDNRRVSISSGISSGEIARIINGTVVSGLIDVVR